MKKWFHGTRTDFETFDLEFIGKGNDEVGSGFYFTDSIETARRYAGSEGYVFVVELELNNPLQTDTTLTSDQVEKLISASPVFDEMIENFGEVALEGVNRVLNRAVSSYMSILGQEFGALECVNSIASDFWDGYEAEFLSKINIVTRHDGLYRDFTRERHAVVWSPDQISIAEKLNADGSVAFKLNASRF